MRLINFFLVSHFIYFIIMYYKNHLHLQNKYYLLFN